MSKLFCIIIFLLVAGNGFCEPLFSENFNTTRWTKDWQEKMPCTLPGTATGWFSCENGAVSTAYGETHWAGEVLSPGREGADDKAYYIWRHDNFHQDYRSLIWYKPPSVQKEIYIRFYMKIPTEFTMSGGTGWKVHRTHQNSVPEIGGKAIYINFNAGFTKWAVNMAYPTGSWTYFGSNGTNSRHGDNTWHCYEFYIKSSTPGNSDGVMMYWQDGTLTKIARNGAWSLDSNDGFSGIRFGFGNSNGGTWQSSWQAVQLDDFVVSTSPIGLAGDSKRPKQ